MPLGGTVSASFRILLPADKINGSDAIVVEAVRPGEQPEAISKALGGQVGLCGIALDLVGCPSPATSLR
jgi:hypothetical protein